MSDILADVLRVVTTEALIGTTLKDKMLGGCSDSFKLGFKFPTSGMKYFAAEGTETWYSRLGIGIDDPDDDTLLHLYDVSNIQIRFDHSNDDANYNYIQSLTTGALEVVGFLDDLRLVAYSEVAIAGQSIEFYYSGDFSNPFASEIATIDYDGMTFESGKFARFEVTAGVYADIYGFNGDSNIFYIAMTDCELQIEQGDVTVNYGQGDHDFTVCGNSKNKLIFVDAGSGDISLGICSASTTTARLFIDESADVEFRKADGTTIAAVKDDGYISAANIYGEIHLHDNSTAQSIPTGTTYTKLINFSGSTSSNCTADHANSKITITKAGKYRVSFNLSGYSGTNGVTFKIAPFIDGNELDNIHVEKKLDNASDRKCAAASGFVGAGSVPMDIDLRVRHDNGGSVNFTQTYANLNVEYVGSI